MVGSECDGASGRSSGLPVSLGYLAAAFGLGAVSSAAAMALVRKKRERTTRSSCVDDDVFVGVDIGGTTVSVIVVKGTGELLGGAMCRPINDKSPQGMCAMVAEMVRDAVIKCGVRLDIVRAAGVCSPGLVDTENGVVVKASNFPAWDNFALCDEVSKRIGGIPTYLEHDANAALLAEIWIGAAKGQKDVAMMTLGTGVGGAILSDGRIIRGAKGMAGEIGHTIFTPHGVLHETTGVRGVFESYASASAVGKIAAARTGAMSPRSKKKRSSLGHLMHLDNISAKHVFAYAIERKDPLAIEIVDETADAIGIMCINLVRFFDCATILLSGGMSLAGDHLLSRVRKAFAAHHWTILPPRARYASRAQATRRAPSAQHTPQFSK